MVRPTTILWHSPLPNQPHLQRTQDSIWEKHLQFRSSQRSPDQAVLLKLDFHLQHPKSYRIILADLLNDPKVRVAMARVHLKSRLTQHSIPVRATQALVRLMLQLFIMYRRVQRNYINHSYEHILGRRYRSIPILIALHRQQAMRLASCNRIHTIPHQYLNIKA